MLISLLSKGVGVQENLLRKVKTLYHQTYYKPNKKNDLKNILCYKYELMRPSKGIVNLVNLKIMCGCLFGKIKFTTNARSSMKVSPCTTVMQKFYIPCMHSSFFYNLLICHHNINASSCSKYCN